MAEENKVYYPETLEETPYPGAQVQVIADTPPSATRENYNPQPQGITEKFPEKFTAPAVISDSINTLTKQILAGFTFGIMGAIQIGEFQSGVSGDIRISPNGIVARNVNGDTTISVDGTTGNVTIKGTLQAGSVIAGATQVGGSSVTLDGANGRIVIHDGTTNRGVFGNV